MGHTRYHWIDHSHKRYQECEKLICELDEWAEYNVWFDRSFLDKIKLKAEEGEDLSLNQITAIENMHDKFIK